ncbi:hypothetical protein [Streptomyces sp. NBC_00197]|uniref:hypothetical protein n=1 Tax=Streptomyces sp. NBC_00197 TaxID=2975676 RepID=UPI0032513D67
MAQNDARVRLPLGIIITLFAMLIVVGLSIVTIWRPTLIPDWVFPLSVAGIGFFFMKGQPFWPDDERQVESRERVRTAEHDLENALRGVPAPVIADDDTATDQGPSVPGQRPTEPQEDTPRLALSELWAVTHRRLDYYHGIAITQAKLSFLNAQVAMGIGFVLLVGFVVVALNASTTAGSVVAGSLGAVSAALAGYVSRTFIRSQEAAAGHLRAYFEQPLEFSRYLAAERLMADAGLHDEKRAEVLTLIVQAMVAGPANATSSQDEPQSRP